MDRISYRLLRSGTRNLDPACKTADLSLYFAHPITKERQYGYRP